jgi:hypothetical protein
MSLSRRQGYSRNRVSATVECIDINESSSPSVRAGEVN